MEQSAWIITIIGGLLIGLVIGSVGRISRFCTFCAVREWLEEGDRRRAGSWAIAIAVAILGVQGLHMAGWLDIGQSIYLTNDFGWAAAIAGGLIFGAGMAMTGSCGFNLVIRSGAGDLKAILALIVMAISGYMAARGITGVARVALFDPLSYDVSALSGQGLPNLIGAVTGAQSDVVRPLVAVAVASVLVTWALGARRGVLGARYLFPAIVMGSMATAGFFITGYLGVDEFDPQPLQSVTYTMPSGNALLYLLTFSGASLNFGIALIGGTLAGSFVTAAVRNDWTVQTFRDVRETVRVLSGAFLMGFGAVTALGCTFGQGITGVSTLSAGSILATAAIITGAAAAVQVRSRLTLQPA